MARRRISTRKIESWIYIAVTTLFVIFSVSCALINRAPIIDELSTDKDYLVMGASSEIHANATDPNNDELTYTWVVTSGEIKGEGSSVTWEAPSTPGAHTITLIVTDGKGGEATSMITLNVTPNRSPIIKRLTTKLVVCQGDESIPIECVASDPDGDDLSYKWTATGGRISGQGPAVSWIAPEKKGQYTVAVEVTDGKGGEVTREKTIRVT